MTKVFILFATLLLSIPSMAQLSITIHPQDGALENVNPATLSPELKKSTLSKLPATIRSVFISEKAALKEQQFEDEDSYMIKATEDVFYKVVVNKKTLGYVWAFAEYSPNDNNSSDSFSSNEYCVNYWVVRADGTSVKKDETDCQSWKNTVESLDRNLNKDLLPQFLEIDTVLKDVSPGDKIAKLVSFSKLPAEVTAALEYRDFGVEMGDGYYSVASEFAYYEVVDAKNAVIGYMMAAGLTYTEDPDYCTAHTTLRSDGTFINKLDSFCNGWDGTKADLIDQGVPEELFPTEFEEIEE